MSETEYSFLELEESIEGLRGKPKVPLPQFRWKYEECKMFEIEFNKYC